MPLFYHAPVWNERRTNEKLFYSNRPSGGFFSLLNPTHFDIIFYIPNIRNSGIQTISYFDIIGALDKRMDNYRARRNSYFQMVNSGYLSIKKQPQQEDFFKSTINSIDTSDCTDIDIMIDKIKSGEIEPNYYDLDDYLSMKRSKRR